MDNDSYFVVFIIILFALLTLYHFRNLLLGRIDMSNSFSDYNEYFRRFISNVESEELIFFDKNIYYKLYQDNLEEMEKYLSKSKNNKLIFFISSEIYIKSKSDYLSHPVFLLKKKYADNVQINLVSKTEEIGNNILFYSSSDRTGINVDGYYKDYFYYERVVKNSIDREFLEKFKKLKTKSISLSLEQLSESLYFKDDYIPPEREIPVTLVFP